MSGWTHAKFLAEVSKRTEAFIRLSTVAGEKGYADTARDPRAFAIKFYTEDGNYDLAGNNTPIFFIRDLLKFPEFIHSQKRDPYTNWQEADNVWVFFAKPLSDAMFTWLFGNRKNPADFRHMSGFGSHTFQWVNTRNEAFWIKYHFITDQRIARLTNQEAALAGQAPDYHTRDRYWRSRAATSRRGH